MIDWKSVLICSGMAIVLSIILSIGGYIIATLYAGYRVGDNTLPGLFMVSWLSS
ncbi:MAG: hypothetical protein AB1604_00050 [Euryarchaeota archaeon]